MAKEIILKKRFLNSLTKLLSYLRKEWGDDATDSFLIKLDARLTTLSHQPYIGAPSEVVKGVRGILVTPKNKVFYKVTDKKLIVLNMKDTRMDPKKNPYSKK
jgi:plasmid stabilization system protein ParE